MTPPATPLDVTRSPSPGGAQIRSSPAPTRNDADQVAGRRAASDRQRPDVDDRRQLGDRCRGGVHDRLGRVDRQGQPADARSGQARSGRGPRSRPATARRGRSWEASGPRRHDRRRGSSGSASPVASIESDRADESTAGVRPAVLPRVELPGAAGRGRHVERPAAASARIPWPARRRCPPWSRRSQARPARRSSRRTGERPRTRHPARGRGAPRRA